MDCVARRHLLSLGGAELLSATAVSAATPAPFMLFASTSCTAGVARLGPGKQAPRTPSLRPAQKGMDEHTNRTLQGRLHASSTLRQAHRERSAAPAASQAAAPHSPWAPVSSCRKKSTRHDTAAKPTDTIRQLPKPSTTVLPM